MIKHSTEFIKTPNIVMFENNTIGNSEPYR